MIIQYQDYVQQIRAFSRSSMIYSSTETSWSIWKRLLDNRLKTDEKPEEIIVKAHVPRIFSISVATGNNHREKLATLGDIVKLSHNYLGVFESINNKKIIESETQDILKYLEESKFIPYPSTDHLKEIVHATVGGLFLQRTFRSQWDSSSYSIHHVMEWSGEPGVGYRLLYRVSFSGQKRERRPTAPLPPKQKTRHSIM